jgi:molybdopterin-guanine dinucleotide biosynthesis protein A
MSRSFPVVVLAGGEGGRMGGGKPLRLLGGETLIGRAVRLARGWSDDVCVVVRDRAQAGPVDCPLIEDDPAIGGPLGGLVAALRYARDAGGGALLAIPCDTPFLPEDLANRLWSGLGDRMAAVAASGGRLHPSCALWKSGALDHLVNYVASGRRSLHGFAEQVGYSEVGWPAKPLDPFFNINDEAQLAHAAALIGR